MQSSSAAARVTVFSPSPLLLYNDVLQSILKFLNAPELHIAVQVSHHWHTLIQTMSPLSLSLSTHSKKLACIPIGTTVARHVAVVENLEFITRSRPDFIYKIGSLFPNLRRIKAFTSDEVLESSSAQQLRLVFPPRLEDVELGCFTMYHFASHTRLLEALTPLSHLHSLSLMFYGQNASLSGVDFSSLLQKKNGAAATPSCLPKLTTFQFSFVDFARTDPVPVEAEENTLSVAFVTFLRQSSLTHLSLRAEFKGVGLPFSRLVDQLTADANPCPLQQSLTSVDTSHDIIDSAVLQSLIRFPQLATLTITRIESDQITRLLLLRNLTQLKLHRPENSKQLNSPEECVQICKHCPQICHLTLDNLSTLDEKRLDESLASLPQLTDLKINNCTSLKSMAPLIKYGLPQRLTHLRLETLEVSEYDAVQFILPLKQLRHLLIWTTNVDRYSDGVKAQLRPGTSTCAFPHLVDSHVINMNKVPREIFF